jgi:hypothetical protein
VKARLAGSVAILGYCPQDLLMRTAFESGAGTHRDQFNCTRFREAPACGRRCGLCCWADRQGQQEETDTGMSLALPWRRRQLLRAHTALRDVGEPALPEFDEAASHGGGPLTHRDHLIPCFGEVKGPVSEGLSVKAAEGRAVIGREEHAPSSGWKAVGAQRLPGAGRIIP